MADDLPLLRACLTETRALRAQPRHARSRRSSGARHRRPPRVSGLLLGTGVLLLALAVPATVQGLQPIPVADAQPRPAGPPEVVVAGAPALAAPHAADDVLRASRAAASLGRAPAATRQPTGATASLPAASAAPLVRTAGVPLRVSVPAANIDAPVSRLGLRPDGSMRVPRTPQVAGWFKRGPRPGEAGAALIVGHVDSKDGPGAFFSLRQVVPGDLIHVLDDNGRSTTFVVDQVSRYRKNRFPTALVFGGVTGSELRLITCSGTFNPITRHYSRNLVVYARLTAGAGA